jgi:hypothetical protein
VADIIRAWGLAVAAFWAVLAAASVAKADVVLTSVDTRISTKVRTDNATGGCVAPSGEDFVVVWAERRRTAPLYRLLLQRFSPTGAIVGTRHELAASNSEIPEAPAIASTGPGGSFVVTWLVHTSTEHRVVGCRYGGDLAPLGDVFDVSSDTNVEAAHVAAADDGSFVVAWTTWTTMVGTSLYARRFSSGGEPLFDPVLVAAPERRQFNRFAVSSAPNGDFVVAWSQSSLLPNVVIQHTTEAALFAANGVKTAVLEMEPTLGVQGRDGLDVAHASDGGFVVLYDDGQYGDASSQGPYDVFGRPFGPDGGARAGASQISEREPLAGNDGWAIRAARTADDGFVVAWTTGRGQASPDGRDSFIHGRHIDGTGTPKGREFFVAEQHTIYSLQMGDIAANGADLFFAWDVPFKTVWGRSARWVESIVCGDATLDGTVGPTDALFALQSSVGTEFCSAVVCDVDSDGAIRLSDALRILRATAGSGDELICPASD